MTICRKKIRTFENLETRYALAGNVNAVIDGSGNLLITGDSLANGINFVETSTGHFDLTGIDAGGSGTTINGSASNGTVQLSGVTGSITIRGGNGNDLIQLPYFNYGGWMIINTGDGNDTVNLGSDAKASFLVGILSIRTNEGTKLITETNINVIGNQDLGATQTDGGAAVSNELAFIVNSSTFGSFLYFNFGGRTGVLGMHNTVQAGDVFIYNRLTAPPVSNIDPPQLVQVGTIFQFFYNNSSMGGNLTFDMTSGSTIETNNSIILGSADIKAIGAANVMNFNGGSFDDLNISTKGFYTTSVGGLPYLGTHNIVESFDDEIHLTNVYCTGDIDLQSNGTLVLNGVTAQNAILKALRNSRAIIDAETSHFANLTLFLGSLLEPNDTGSTSEPSDPDFMTEAKVVGSVVTGVLTIDTNSRIKPITVLGAEAVQRKYTLINQSAASYSITSSVIGSLIMNGVTEQGTAYPDGAEPGPNTLNIATSTITTVNLSLPRSDDTVSFNGSNVTGSTIVNGGAGYNLFYNNGSILTNLQKVNFAN